MPRLKQRSFDSEDKDALKALEQTLLERAKDGRSQTLSINEYEAAKRLKDAGKIKVLEDANERITYELAG